MTDIDGFDAWWKEYNKGASNTDSPIYFVAERGARHAWQAARAKCEADRRDAERYRWLREPGQDVAFIMGYAGAELDAAIDAAKEQG